MNSVVIVNKNVNVRMTWYSGVTATIVAMESQQCFLYVLLSNM